MITIGVGGRPSAPRAEWQQRSKREPGSPGSSTTTAGSEDDEVERKTSAGSFESMNDPQAAVASTLELVSASLAAETESEDKLANYSASIKACAHNGDADGAQELLQRMTAEGYEVPMDVYNNVIHACAQAGDLPSAEWYLNHMEQKGLQPDLKSYNLALNACAARGDATRLEMWLHCMFEQNMVPTTVTYGTICKAFARLGEVKKVEQIMQMLEATGQPLNEYFYAALISACGAASPPDPRRAERALEELVERGLRPQSVKRALSRVIGGKR
eukprot:CAMPEP_0179289102 /NCGR_PEP_ID=MMETSP0797-20121207/41126_1 /TAXON_ID=47934 /ORGANISM="Dinophysis acuminata, Strain DAEP01" /LENGTH=272 /DNA_ID=CAMNT_0020998091 /DNA_START=55 /DNA_END=870 /DNA_ORIENTATION=-